MTTETQPIPTVGAPEPVTVPAGDLLLAVANSPLMPTIAIVAIGWGIVSHVDRKFDALRQELDSKITSVRTELLTEIQRLCPGPQYPPPSPPTPTA